MQITDKEYNQIIEELANRLRDMVYINAEKKMREKLSKDSIEELLDENAILEIEHGYTFLVDDLRLATQQEQFLYHILGPHILGEEDEV